MQLSKLDKEKISRVIDNKLGPNAVEGQIRNKTTNQCESSHLTVLKSVPKSRTYRRNFRGRAHSAVNSISIGETKSVDQANRYLGAGCSASSPANKSRERNLQNELRIKQRKQSYGFKISKRISNLKKRRIHMQTKNNQGYATGCQDPVVRGEHSYSK